MNSRMMTFEDISDTDFSDVEEFDVNDERSETGFAASLHSVACDNVTAIANNFRYRWKKSGKKP